jgi:hypothetical protein
MQHSDASANHDTLTTDKIPEHKFKSSSLQGVKPAAYQRITQEQKNVSETRTLVLHLHTLVASLVLQGIKPAVYQRITQEQKNISETRTPVLHLHASVASPVLHLHIRSQFVRSFSIEC